MIKFIILLPKYGVPRNSREASSILSKIPIERVSERDTGQRWGRMRKTSQHMRRTHRMTDILKVQLYALIIHILSAKVRR